MRAGRVGSGGQAATNHASAKFLRALVTCKGTYRWAICKLDHGVDAIHVLRVYRQSLLLLLTAFQTPADDNESDEELRRKLLGHDFSQLFD